MKVTSAEFVVSANSPSQFPRGRLPEIAFSGRSNVGKSSLLNRIVGQKIAKTSSAPGKTQTVNFFLINRKFHFVDLPGYGFACVSRQTRDSWRRLIEEYIGKRETLRAVVVIIDVRREEIPSTDLQMIEYLHSIGVPAIIALTKADKLSRSQLSRALRARQRQLPSGAEIIPFSAVTGEGVRELSQKIEEYLG
jgi:GTP-binding protein